jgi:hypothetical protein
VTSNPQYSYQENVDTILFSRQPAEDDETFLNNFSVPLPGQNSVKARAIVLHHGSDTGAGEWVCLKDGNSQCGHITLARHQLQKLVQVNPRARDDSTLETCADEGVPGQHFTFMM